MDLQYHSCAAGSTTFGIIDYTDREQRPANEAKMHANA